METLNKKVKQKAKKINDINMNNKSDNYPRNKIRHQCSSSTSII